MNKLDMESKDIVKDNLEYIKERFPEAITEENGIIKFDGKKNYGGFKRIIILNDTILSIITTNGEDSSQWLSMIKVPPCIC